jgi:hypothetical protein
MAGNLALDGALRKNVPKPVTSGDTHLLQKIAASSSSEVKETNSDYAPAGAVDIGQVDPGTGKLSFSGPIASVGGATTPAFSLSASYSSTQVYETTINWNYEQVPSEVGLGFSLPSAHMRIARLASPTGVAWNDSFMLMTGGSDYRLELIGEDNTNKIKYYSTNDANHLRVEYHYDLGSNDPAQNSYWLVTDSSGNKSYYGWAYRSGEGTAENQSTAFKTFCTQLEESPSFNNYDGSDVNADYCEFGPVEVDVRWGAWNGVSMNTVNQEQFATSWYLSAMEGLNGRRTSLFYGRHTQDVGAQDSSNSNRVADALSFTKASYLYHAITDDGDALVLNWGGRSNTEVLDPRTVDPEPDGYQEKYQILYLSSVNKASGGTYYSSSGFTTDPTPLTQVDLDYNSEVLLGFDNPQQYMGKRILTEITPSYYNFYKTQANGGVATYDPQPSYSFSYWGQSQTQQTANGAALENNDGVSVSRWNDASGFNAANGGLYGLLKTVTSPEGLTATFRYSNAQGTGVQRSLIVSNDDLKLTDYRHAYVGPGYMLVSGAIENYRNMFYIYAWTSQGWKQVVAQESREGGFTRDFTLDPDTNKSNNMSNWVAAGTGIVGVLMPSNGDKDTNATCFDVYVFAQDRGKETWSALGTNSTNSPFFGNYCGNVRLDVSLNAVTVVSGEQQQYHLWYSNNNWQDDDGITSYSGSLSHTESGKDLVVGTQIGDGFAAFYVVSSYNVNSDQTLYADLIFVKEEGVQEVSAGTANIVSKALTLGDQAGPLTVIARDIYGQGSELSIVIPYYNTQTGDTDGETVSLNHMIRGSFVIPAEGTVAAKPLPADNTPIDYASQSGGSAGDYITLSLWPPEAKDDQIGYDNACCGWFSEFISSNMLVGTMNWLSTDIGQSLACGIAISTPTGFGSWNDFDTSVDDAGSGDNCFFGENGDFSGSEFFSSDDVFAVSRGKGGGYASWVYDPSSDSVVRNPYATMVYFPPRVHSSMQGLGWEIFDETMMVVGILMLASGWGSAIGSAVTGEFLSAAMEGVMSAAFTFQMTEPYFAHERITGGPLSYFGASRRIFYFGENFWVRNADDTLSVVSIPSDLDHPEQFEAAGLDSYKIRTQPAGLISNYLPLTYYTSWEKSGDNTIYTDFGTYLFEFRNGDVRRDDSNEYAPLMPSPLVVSNDKYEYWTSEVPEELKEWRTNVKIVEIEEIKIDADVDYLTGDAAFILYDGTWGNFNNSIDYETGNEQTFLDFGLFAVVDHEASGEILDKVVASVEVDDGTKRTVVSYDYQEDTTTKTARYSQNGMTGFYPITQVTLEGTQETLFVAGTESSSGCLSSNPGIVNFTGIGTDSTCEGGSSSDIFARWLQHDDGRIESLAQPGQCMSANTSYGTSGDFDSQLQSAACNPAVPMQKFALVSAGSGMFYIKSLGVTDSDSPDTTYCAGSGSQGEWTDCTETSSLLQVKAANVDNSSRTAGYTLYYNYADAGGDSARQVLSVPQAQAGLDYQGPVDTDFPATRTSVLWTDYFSYLLGSTYRTESYRDGATTPYSVKDTTHEVVDLTPNGISDGELTWRDARAAWTTTIQDGVSKTEAYEYNLIGQLRATHSTTQKLLTSADSSGTVTTSAQPLKSSSYSYYAWEVSDYRAKFLAENRLSDVYLSYKTVSDNNAAPQVSGAAIQTYMEVQNANGTSVMVPQAGYTGRGNSIDILPTVAVAYYQLTSSDSVYKPAADWGCVQVANNAASLSDDCGDMSAPADSALYIAHKILSTAAAPDKTYPVTYMFESKASAGYCLKKTTTSPYFTLSACNLSDGGQTFALETLAKAKIGYNTQITSYESGETSFLYGFYDSQSEGAFAGWNDGGVSEYGSKVNPAMVIPYPLVQLAQPAGYQSASADECLAANNDYSLSFSTSCTGEQSLFIARGTGSLESLSSPGYCLIAQTSGDVEASVNNLCANNDADAAFRLVFNYNQVDEDEALSYVSLRSIGVTVDNLCLGSYAGENEPIAWSDCDSSSATPFKTASSSASIIPSPSSLDSASDQWIKSNAILAWDDTLSQPLQQATYFGVSSKGALMGITKSALVSQDGRGLTIAQFGGADTAKYEAGYFGFETYETSAISDADYCTAANWSCTGGKIAGENDFSGSAYAPHAGSSYAYYAADDGISVTPANFSRATDIYGNVLDYVISAWVAPAEGETCLLSMEDENGDAIFSTGSAAGDASTWYYLEAILPASSSIGSNKPVVQCSNGGAIDDVRYSTAVGGFAAAIYDPSSYYRPQAQLMDDGKVGRSAYDDRNGIIASYVERLDSTDHSVASRMLSNFTVAGYSRYNGFGQLNTYTDPNTANAFDIYSSSQPNAGASVTFAPEASLFCEQVPALSSDTVCPATSSDGSDYTMNVIGSAFALNALVTPKTSASGKEGVSNQTPITLSWTPPSGGGAKLTFEYASGSAVNGTFNLYSAANPNEPVGTSQTMAVPRQWMIVVYEDNAFVFGDGKLVLSTSADSSDPWTVENYLFTTATTTITVDSDGASFTNLGAGSAPVLGMSYMNAAGQPIQRHILNLMRSASAEQQQGSLVDVTDAKLFDGWGGPAVQTLSMYYAGNTDEGDVEMLAYRASFLPVFDWTNGKIDTDDGITSDLYAFYATGAGADRVQFAQDPSYALAFANRYQEPAGRDNQGAGVGYPLSLAASQSRVTTTDYQDWNDADLGAAVGIDSAALQSDFNTSTNSGGFGANLTTYSQSVKDVNGLSGVNRQAWIATSAAANKNKKSSAKSGLSSGEVLSGGMFSLNVPVPSTLTPSPGVSGTLARYMQSLLPNYFAGNALSGTGNFVNTEAYVDVLGQWRFGYDPNSTGSKHVFADDAGRPRLTRANPDLTDTTSQGFEYKKRDAWGRVIEIGVLIGVANANLETYADWVRQADFDQQLTSENSCALKIIVYDVAPESGALEAYSNRRGRVSREVYYTTVVDDQPTSCAGREASSTSNQIWHAYDDLARETAYAEYRVADSETYRTTAFEWLSGGLVTQWVYPDADQNQAFVITGQSSMSLWPDLFGRPMRICDGADCSGTVYLDKTAFDWMGNALASKLGNGLVDSVSYDFAGDELSHSLTKGETEVFGETVLNMQLPSGGAEPCGGSAESPNYSGGFVFAHGLSGSGLPSQDQNSWTCFTYDGVGRLVQSNTYTNDGGTWTGQVSYGYSYDPNGNLTSIETGVPSVGAQGASLSPKLGTSLAGAELPLQITEAAAEGSSTSFTRSGSDQLTGASLASGTSFGLAFDSGNTYGDVSAISSGSVGYSLSLTRDAHSRQVTAQTITNNATSETVLTASMAYDPIGRRTSRTVTAVDEGSGSSVTEYWYGKALVPLVVERDGVTYRMLGGLVIEERVNGKASTQYYPHRDYTSSVRVVTDGTGAVGASLGYNGDWGSARIQGQDHAASDDGMEVFYRFQGQEAEIFPLSALNISDEALESWLDELQLYHFPYREYSAGLAIFLSHDPARQSISPYAAFGANPANFTDPTGAVVEGHMPWYGSRTFRDPMYTLVWGVCTIGLLASWYFTGAQTDWVTDRIAYTFGRWVSNFFEAEPPQLVRTGEHYLAVGQPLVLSHNPHSRFDLSFEMLTQQELWEAFVGQVFSLVFYQLAVQEGVDDAGAVLIGAIAFFLSVAAVDLVWGIRRDNRNDAEVYAHEVDIGRIYDSAYGAEYSVHSRAVFSADTFYYGVMSVVWTISLEPTNEYTAGALWFMRNAGHRALREGVKTVLKLLFGDRRRIADPARRDNGSIYVVYENGGFSVFTWNYDYGRARLNLAGIIDFMYAHPELADPGVHPGQSWEELMYQEHRPAIEFQPLDVQVQDDAARPMLDHRINRDMGHAADEAVEIRGD